MEGRSGKLLGYECPPLCYYNFDVGFARYQTPANSAEPARPDPHAEVAEFVDALASGASELFARGGSSPLLGTSNYSKSLESNDLKYPNGH